MKSREHDQQLIRTLFELMAMAAVIALAVDSVAARLPFGPESGQDAMVFRSAARLVLAGRSPYQPTLIARWIESHWTSLPAGGPIPFAYPPPALPVLTLYGLGDVRFGVLFAAGVFTTAMALGLRAFCVSIDVRGSSFAAVALSWAFSGPALLNGLLDQTGTLVCGLALLFVRAFPEHPRWAGLVLGLTIVKPQYTPFLALVACVEKRGLILGIAALTWVALCAFATAVFGPKLWVEWFEAARAPNWTVVDMGNWISPWLALTHADPLSAQRAAPFVMAAGLIALSAFLFRTVHRAPPGPDSSKMRVGFALCAAAVFSPNTHPYDLLFLVIPLLLPPGLRAARVFACAAFLTVLLVLHARPALPFFSIALAFWSTRSLWCGEQPQVPRA